MMKRIPAIFLAIGGLVTAAGAGYLAYADLKQGTYRPAELGSLNQATPPELSPDSSYQVSAYPVPAVDLAPGDGVAEVRIYCGTCHSPRYITMQPPLPAATWEAEVAKMKKAFGAEIPEDSAQRIIMYLQAHYTPENRKP